MKDTQHLVPGRIWQRFGFRSALARLNKRVESLCRHVHKTERAARSCMERRAATYQRMHLPLYGRDWVVIEMREQS